MLEKLFKIRKKPQKQNNSVQAARKKIILQAAIAFQTIILAVVLIFGMSAAWYTNVLQTSGLQFEAEAWGFTGEILVANEPIQAKPGDTGVVGLTAANDSDDMINIAVRVSKEQMVEEMRKRLFFYVDTAVSRNEETMERAYINTQDSYTYTILSHSDLTLTEDYANDVLLKWQWVYDMEGYYFLGTVTASVDGNGNQTVVSVVDDYLRPVEYDLDSATFNSGLLATVGELTVEEFIDKLSETDGYEEDLVAAENMTGYYQVDVDENGYGVWVYLCNWAEIQQATTYDTQLGQKAAAAQTDNTIKLDQYTARLMVVGQTTRGEYSQAWTAEQVAELLNGGNMVQLQNDLVLTEPLAINSGTNVVLDLNKHSIQAPEGQAALTVTDATRLTMLNGNLKGSTDTKNLVEVSGSMLTMSNVSLTGDMKYGVFIADTESTTDSCVRLFDCTIDASTSAVSVRGNGEATEGRTQLIIENCELTSEYITVLGNGTADYWGTDIQIIDSKITGFYAALYQPQGDSLTRAWNSTFEAGTGIVIKGGDLRLTGCVVKGTATAQTPAYNNSGFTDTGDALYIDGSYDVPMNILLEGDCALSSENSCSIQVFEPEENTSTITVSVTGGTYDESVIPYVAEGYTYNETTGKVEKRPEEEEATTDSGTEQSETQEGETDG